MTGIMQMIASHKVPSPTVSSVTYANMVFNLDAAGYGALPGNVITTSASFDGSTQSLAVANTAAFAFGTTDFTMEFWWRPTSAVRSDVLDFYDEPGGGLNTRLLFGASITTGSLELYIDHPGGISGGIIQGAATSTILNSWNHLALTRQSGNIKMWLNGTQTGSTYNSNVLNFGQSGQMSLSIMKDHAASADGSGTLSQIRVNANTAVYTANFTPSTSTLRPIAGTQLLLPLVATPFTDISTNEFTVTNNGTVSTTANSAPTLTAVTTDLTGTYAMTRTGASISWKSTGTGGYFEKNNATGTDHITGGPNYAISQSYTVFMAYQGDSRSGGRLLNTANEGVSDWVAGTYASGTLYKNVFYPNGTVNLNSDSYVGNSGWNFLWALYDTATGWGNLYIATSGVNANVGPTAVYKNTLVGTGSTHGFNQFRLWSRSVGAEVQTGNIGLVRVYDNVMPLAQIQSVWANLHSRFGI